MEKRRIPIDRSRLFTCSSCGTRSKSKILIQRALRADGAWEAGDGWEALRLSGWSRERLVVLVREAPALALVRAQARPRRDHLAQVSNILRRFHAIAEQWTLEQR